MNESVRTPEPRVQGQGICPDCDFASRPATKDNLRRQPTTSFPLVQRPVNELPHSLIISADKTNGREMLCSPELHQTTRDTNSATLRYHVCRVSALCPSAKLFTLEPDNGLCAHMDVTSCDVTSATTQSSSVRVCASAV